VGSVSRFAHLGLDERFMAHPILKHPALGADGVRFIHDYFQLVRSLRPKTQPLSIMREILASRTYGFIVEQLATRRATLKNGEIDATKKEEATERIRRKGVLLTQLAGAYGTLEKFINAMVLGAGNLLQIHLAAVSKQRKGAKSQ